jgi:hypothetical protein
LLHATGLALIGSGASMERLVSTWVRLHMVEADRPVNLADVFLGEYSIGLTGILTAGACPVAR